MLANSAVFGFGASFGRDIYKKTKDASLLLFALAILFLTVWGYRGLARNIGNDIRSNKILRILGSVLSIVAGTTASSYFLYLYTDGDMTTVIGLHIVSAAIGIFWGRMQKHGDENNAAIALANLQFLEANGLHDSQFEADLIEDEDGNNLRVKETRDDAIIFTVVGKRGLRAMISLDGGRMVDYSGVVRL